MKEKRQSRGVITTSYSNDTGWARQWKSVKVWHSRSFYTRYKIHGVWLSQSFQGHRLDWSMASKLYYYNMQISSPFGRPSEAIIGVRSCMQQKQVFGVAGESPLACNNNRTGLVIEFTQPQPYDVKATFMATIIQSILSYEEGSSNDF